jgi:hypothetical protein
VSGLTLEKIKQYYESTKYIPTMSDDDVFCWGCDVRTKIATVDDPIVQVIRMYFTTRRLSRVGPQIDGSVNVDPTYKLNREGCKGVIVGMQDAARHFHIGGFGVLSIIYNNNI